MYMQIIKVETDNDVKHFNKKASTHGTVIVGFFMTHCPACIAFKPEWEKFVAHHKLHGNGDAMIAEVDSNQAANVNFDTSQLDGFPTVLVKNNDENEATMFNDKREAEALKKFLKDAMERKSNMSGGKKYKKTYKKKSKKRKNKIRRKSHKNKRGGNPDACEPNSDMCCLKDGIISEDGHLGPLEENDTWQNIMEYNSDLLDEYEDCSVVPETPEEKAQKKKARESASKRRIEANNKRHRYEKHQQSMVNPHDTTPTTMNKYHQQLRSGPGIWENVKGAIGDAFGMGGGRRKKKKKSRKNKKNRRKTKRQNRKKPKRQHRRTKKQSKKRHSRGKYNSRK